MKRIFAIGLVVALVGAFADAANVPLSPPDAGLVRTMSDQFLVHAATQTTPLALERRLATNANYLELAPARLAVASERIKQAVYRELGDLSPWRGRIHLHLQPARALDENVTIVSERFPNGWNYRLALPQFIERQRFVRAIVQSLLMELANRRAGDRAAEIPAWLTEGLTQRLLAMPDIELTPPETRWTRDGQAIGATVFDIRRVDPRKPATAPAPGTAVANAKRVIWVDPVEEARRQLLARPPLTLAELSWPTDQQLAGPAGPAYRRSAELFLTELLRLKDGRDCLRAMLDGLAGCYNWQTAFFRAFHAHFARQLDLEKWWSLQVANFTGRDTDHFLTLEESWRELDRIVRTPAEVRHATNELPARTEVTLQFILRQWDQVQQTPALQARVRDLEAIRLRAAPELADLIADYHNVLSSYLRLREKVGFILASTTRDPNAKLRMLALDAIRQLDALDARRAALKPPDNSTSPALVEGKPPSAP